jgi:heavy metal translocating P-type ATPase
MEVLKSLAHDNESICSISHKTATNCFHCRKEVDNSSGVTSNGRLFCCSGCCAVYEFLNLSGLDNFYHLREENNFSASIKAVDKAGDGNYEYLDQENFISYYTTEERPLTMSFYIEGIHCAACLWLIEKVPEIAPQIEHVALNMSTSVAEVKFRGKEGFSAFPRIIKRLGYKAHPIRIDDEAGRLRNKEKRETLFRLAIAAVCAGNIMLLSAAIYSGAEGIFAREFGLINFVLTIPVITYSALPFYKSVLASLTARRATVDIPIVFVIVAGFLFSAFNYFRGSEQVYFDSITTFVFLLIVSRYFLRSIHERVSNKGPIIDDLFSKDRILLWDEDSDQYFYSPVSELKSGEIVKLRKGERIPVDGKILSSTAQLNLAFLTGETIPRTFLKNEEAQAGCILESDEVIIEVGRTGQFTRLGKILQEVQRNFENKSSFSTYSDRYSTVFTSVVAVIAIFSFGIISLLHDPSEALKRIISFILISCPCAFVFALPLALAMSLKSAIEKGILIKQVAVFERVPHLKNVFFDKTGTLTKGVFKIWNWNVDGLPVEDQAALIAIEKRSNHPIARAIVERLSDRNLTLPEVSKFEQVYSKGVAAEVNGHVYELMPDEHFGSEYELGHIITTRISVYKDKQKISTIRMGDQMKEDANHVINELKKRRFNVFIVSGDKKYNVEQVSGWLCVPSENIYWQRTPEEKTTILKQKKDTMMVGDGFNDAGALSSADISLAVQGSVEQSLKVSDAYLLNNDLCTILDFIDHANVTSKTLKRNKAFSVFYNLTAGTFALLGYINPLIAAIMMPLSSILLIGSTLYGSRRIALGIRRQGLS